MTNQQNRKLFIGALAPNADPISLRNLFEKHGRVAALDLKPHFGFIVSDMSKPQVINSF